MVNLELGSYRPDVAWPQGRLRADKLAFAPRRTADRLQVFNFVMLSMVCLLVQETDQHALLLADGNADPSDVDRHHPGISFAHRLGEALLIFQSVAAVHIELQIGHFLSARAEKGRHRDFTCQCGGRSFDSSRLPQELIVDWCLPQAHSRRRKYRVENGRREAGCSGLPDTTGVSITLYNLDLDLRRFIDAQNSIAIEVGLLHAALVERDFAPEHCRDSEGHAALHLGNNRIGIYDHARIQHDKDPIDLHLTRLADGHLGDLAHVRAESLLHRYAATLPWTQRLAPVRKLSGTIEYVQGAWVLL